MWVRGIMVAFAGFGGIAMAPSISLAQYPGSAGNLNDGTLGAASSASSGSASTSASTSATRSDGVSGGGSGDGSASGGFASGGSATRSGSSANGNSADGRAGYGDTTAAALPSKKATRKRALIRQFRLEFAKTMTIETVNQRPLRALSADVYLDQFSEELDTGLDQQADVNSLGRDLALVRDALDDRLDVVIASYGGDAPRRGFFAKNTLAGGATPALRTEVQKLKLKHELLEFGEYSLQAMGYYAK
ncbi:MAG: hypothetical protein ACO3SW_07365 [Candidatus Puniceispirillaceae bacterium]